MPYRYSLYFFFIHIWLANWHPVFIVVSIAQLIEQHSSKWQPAVPQASSEKFASQQKMEFLSLLLMASDENQHRSKLLVSELLAQHTTSDLKHHLTCWFHVGVTSNAQGSAARAALYAKPARIFKSQQSTIWITYLQSWNSTFKTHFFKLDNPGQL